MTYRPHVISNTSLLITKGRILFQFTCLNGTYPAVELLFSALIAEFEILFHVQWVQKERTQLLHVCCEMCSGQAPHVPLWVGISSENAAEQIPLTSGC